jgi:hypothetical protein
MDTIEIIDYYDVYHDVEDRYDKDVTCGADLSEYDHEKWHREEESVPLANLCRYPD